MRSILSLPPVLQAVWRDVYSAAYNAELTDNYRRELCSSVASASDCAEEAAWEAVRRANGGEMPEEAADCGDDPTLGNSLRSFALVVASARYGDGWDELGLLSKKNRVEDAERQLENPTSSVIARVALASWKAARAWGRK